MFIYMPYLIAASNMTVQKYYMSICISVKKVKVILPTTHHVLLRIQIGK